MMSGPELPYIISILEEALALLRKITKKIDNLYKRFDNLCDNLCLHLDNIFASSDLYTDLSSGLDYGVEIAPGFRGTSNHDPHISRLRTQTRFFTPLSCDLEPDITKPTPRKIFA